jgi:beta-1,2-mannobiose phosphorylase / 1,2-beta-oligomannan phosphorylase
MKKKEKENALIIKDKLLLKPKDFKPSFNRWTVEGVLNPAAVRLPNKKIMLYARVAESAGVNHKKLQTCPVIATEEDYTLHFDEVHKGKIFKMGGNVVHLKDGTCRLTTLSHFRKIILSEDGFSVQDIHQHPVFTGKVHDGKYGVEDPRITYLNEEKLYAMTYVTVNEKEGVCTSLATIKDINSKEWERKGIIFREQNKDAFLFPEKIDGKYVAVNRPEGFFQFSKPSIWISHSPDLKYWGDESVLMQPRKDSWEQDRLGGGCPPIKTEKGWLFIYHGVRNIKDKGHYSAGVALLDLKDPKKLIARSPKNEPLLAPTSSYESEGFIDNVVFPTGAIPTIDNKHLLIYSGGADKIISVKKLLIEDIFKHMKTTNLH